VQTCIVTVFTSLQNFVFFVRNYTGFHSVMTCQYANKVLHKGWFSTHCLVTILMNKKRCKSSLQYCCKTQKKEINEKVKALLALEPYLTC